MKFTSYFLFFVLFFTPLWAEENTLIVCENSLETLAWDMEFIDHAEHSIELSSYCMGGDILTRLLEKIENRLSSNPHIQVYILCSPILFEEEQETLFQHLQDTYPDNFHLQLTGNVLKVLPNYITTENHLKFLVVDEHYFSVGGSNFDEYLTREGTTTPQRREQESIVRATIPAGTRDQDVVGRGAVARDLRIAFHKLFALWKNYRESRFFESNPEFFAVDNHFFPVDGEKPLIMKFETSEKQIPVSSIKVLLGYGADKENQITQEYAKLILGAQKEIAIAQLYFAPHELIYDSLLASVNKDVQICLITNGMWDHELIESTQYCWPARIRYLPLFYGRSFRLWERPYREGSSLKNTHIFEYDVFDVIYHKKLMVIDQSKVLIGSYNFSRKSHRGDFELALSIDSAEVATQVLKVLERDKTFSKQINDATAQTWYFDPFIAYKAALQEQLLSTIF